MSSAAPFFKKNELLLAVLVGLFVLLLVHSNNTKNRDPALPPATSVDYIRIFVISVSAFYILFYLLSTMTGGQGQGQTDLQKLGGGDATEEVLSEAIDVVMRNIDLNEPAF